jgi:putative endonuclease
MASRSRTLYCGVTSDLETRVEQHQNGTFGGFTTKYRCTRLVWFERFALIDNAIAREKEIKGWRREKKVALIERENRTWEDLSAGWGKQVPRFAYPMAPGRRDGAPKREASG